MTKRQIQMLFAVLKGTTLLVGFMLNVNQRLFFRRIVVMMNVVDEVVVHVGRWKLVIVETVSFCCEHRIRFFSRRRVFGMLMGMIMSVMMSVFGRGAEGRMDVGVEIRERAVRELVR